MRVVHMGDSTKEVIELSDDDERPTQRPLFGQYVQERQRDALKVKKEELAKEKDQNEDAQEMTYSTQKVLTYERSRINDLLALCKRSSESAEPVPTEAWAAVEQRTYPDWLAEQRAAQHPVQPQPQQPQAQKKKQKQQNPPPQLQQTSAVAPAAAAPSQSRKRSSEPQTSAVDPDGLTSQVRKKVARGWAAVDPAGDSVEVHQLQPGDVVWGEWQEDRAWYKGLVTGSGTSAGVEYDDGDVELMVNATARRWIRAWSTSSSPPGPAPTPVPAPAPTPAPAPAQAQAETPEPESMSAPATTQVLATAPLSIAASPAQLPSPAMATSPAPAPVSLPAFTPVPMPALTPVPMPALTPTPSITAAPTCDALSELIRQCCCAGHTKVQRDDNFAALLQSFGTWAKVRAAPIEEVKLAVYHGGNAESKATRIMKVLNGVAGCGDSLASLQVMSRPEAQKELVRLTGFKDKNCATVQIVLNYLLDKEAWRSMMHAKPRDDAMNHHFWHGKKLEPAGHCASFGLMYPHSFTL